MKLFKKKLHYIFIIAIILLGFWLRQNNLYTWPRLGATFDEYAWTWQGINLIQRGVPVSWSPHSQYKNRYEIRYQKAAFILVTPYLEHPPVFGLIAGSYALFNGAKDMYDIDIQKIRGLALILGLSSILLIYLLTLEIFDKKTALLASVLYATIPTIVVGSRLVQNENFFIPGWLTVLILVSKYLKTKKSVYRNLAAIICGLLVLAKIPWIAAAISVVLIFMFTKNYRDIFKFLGIFIPMFLLYFVYGFYYDKEVFLGLWRLQLNRYDLGFVSIFALFQKPFLADRYYLDGWIYWGWFSLFILLIKDIKKYFFIILPLLSYFIIFLAGIPDEPGHGWYRYPFYPFLVISIALFIKEYFSKNPVLTFFFLTIVGMSLFQLTWGDAFGFSFFIFRALIIFWSFALVSLLLPFKKLNKSANFTNYLWLCIFLLLNVWAVMLYNEQ